MVTNFIWREEEVHVQTLIAEPPVEAFDEALLDRLTGPNEVQLNPVAIGPCIHGATGKFAAVVDGNHFGIATVLGDLLQSRHDLGPRQREIPRNEWTVPTPVIDNGEGSNAPSIEYGVGHNIQTPPLIDSVRQWGTTRR